MQSHIIIGLHGQKGTGKDTVTDYLCQHHNFIKLSFAQTLKEIISLITGWSYDFIDGKINRDDRETIIHPVYNMTCRQLLQFVGTDLFRNQLHSDIWTNCLKNKLDKNINNGNTKIVITDCRFQNEIELLQNYNSHIWTIQRISHNNSDNHISEQTLHIPHTQFINNNSNIDNLYQYVENLYQQLYLKN